jgi:hypothetical protein
VGREASIFVLNVGREASICVKKALNVSSAKCIEQ